MVDLQRRDNATAITHQMLTLGENAIVIESHSRFAPPVDTSLHFEVISAPEDENRPEEQSHEFEGLFH